MTTSQTTTTTPSSTTTSRKPGPSTTPSVIYSQPADTGTGRYAQTQIVYAIEYLKSKDAPIPFDEIFRYLSIPDATQEDYENLQEILRRSRQVHHVPDAYGEKKDSFRFRPKHNVRNAEELRAFLQSQKTAQGISVKDLKDGWPGAVAAIDELEDQRAVLVVRNKKDPTPKTVWNDDPSLHHTVDPEFQALWHQVKIPVNQGDLRKELVEMGMTPTSQAKTAVMKPKEKKRKAPRRGGKTTNTHMAGILKDYSHLRK